MSDPKHSDNNSYTKDAAKINSNEHQKVMAVPSGYSTDINALGDDDGFTVLHRAVRAENYSMVKLLLEHGADANVRDYAGLTPLHWCSSNVEILDLLIQHGADINATIDHQNYGKMRMIHFAVKKGLVDIAVSLIKHKADINVKDSYGSTPLHFAAQACNLELVKLLVENKADLNIKDNSGLIPVQLGENKGCTREILRLLSFKEYNDKLLVNAIKENNIEEAKLLIEEGVNINRPPAKQREASC